MKLVLYAPSFYPPVVDGTSIQAAREAGLLASDHEVYSLSFAVDRDVRPLAELSADSDVERLPPEYIEVEPPSRFPLLAGGSLVKRIQEIDPDVLIVRGWYQLKVIEEVIVSCPNLKILWHVDGLHECHDRFKDNSEYWHVIATAIQAHVVVAGLSSFDIPLLTELGFSFPQIYVFPPLVDLFISKEAKQWSTARFLSLGRFIPHKHHQFVYDEVCRLFPGRPVILAGAADSKQSFDCVEQLMQRKASVFLNPAFETIRNLFAWATHFLSGSVIESLGVSTVEAVAAGCVPLVRDVGGIKTYLPEQCIYESEKEFAIKLNYLCVPEHAAAVSKELWELRQRLKPNRVRRAINEILLELP